MFKNGSPESSPIEANRSNSLIEMTFNLDGFQSIPPTEIIYKDGELGRGTFSQVKSATWTKGGVTQTVAVKIVDHKYLETFNREVQAQTRLKSLPEHPNLVSVHGQIDSVEQHALVMEYLDGRTLQKWLDKTSRNTTELSQTAHEIALDTLRGLMFLHANRIIHSDLKPDNIFLIGKLPKIIDLGNSRILPEGSESILIKPGDGTLCYSPIEKLQPNGLGQFRLSDRTDIYSFALILLLCASIQETMPNPQDNTYQKIMRRFEINKPPYMPPEIPPNTQALLTPCFNHEQFKRPSAQELYGQLEGVMKAQFKN